MQNQIRHRYTQFEIAAEIESARIYPENAAYHSHPHRSRIYIYNNENGLVNTATGDCCYCWWWCWRLRVVGCRCVWVEVGARDWRRCRYWLSLMLLLLLSLRSSAAVVAAPVDLYCRRICCCCCGCRLWDPLRAPTDSHTFSSPAIGPAVERTNCNSQHPTMDSTRTAAIGAIRTEIWLFLFFFLLCVSCMQIGDWRRFCLLYAQALVLICCGEGWIGRAFRVGGWKRDVSRCGGWSESSEFYI